jgi:hypothetical protein
MQLKFIKNNNKLLQRYKELVMKTNQEDIMSENGKNFNSILKLVRYFFSINIYFSLARESEKEFDKLS